MGAPLGGGKERDRDGDGERWRLQERENNRDKNKRKVGERADMEGGVGNGREREHHKDEKINATEKEVYRETEL